MSRIGSGDALDIGTWAQGDNPGAGSQDFTIFTDTGLNGNFKRLWRGIKVQHNADGTHQNDVITGANIVAAAVDNATLEASAGTGAKTFRVKDLGIITAKINDLAVTTAKINDLAVTTAKIADVNVTTAKIADLNVTTGKINDLAVTAAKISHDNNRIKVCFLMTYKSGDSYIRAGDVIQSIPGPGIQMPRAGSITAVYVCDTAGSGAGSSTIAYDASSGLHHNHFNAGAILTGHILTGKLDILIDYVVSGHYQISYGTPDCIITIEVEFD